MLSCMAGWSGFAFAGDPPGNSTSAQQGSHPPAAANAQPVYVDGFGQAVSATTLGHYSGGSTVIAGIQTITGTVSNDSATNVTTGANSIAGGSFSDASGLPSVIQNTGNNVLIQNGVIVNVQMKP
ncbi:hypothetical protein GCM10010872_25450 [Dyella flava]|nr:hypothetical protein GCM10010872_25450 [Dyella flava]